MLSNIVARSPMFIKKHRQKTDKNFVSEIDKQLTTFKRKHPNTQTQQAEIDKYQKIYQFRDHAMVEKKKKDLWDF